VMDHLEIKGNQVHLGHLVTGALLEYLDQLDPLEAEDRWGLKENVVILENQAKKVHQDHQASKAQLGQLVQEEKEEKRVPWENLAHLDSQVDLVIRVHQELLEVWVLLEDLDCRDNPVRQVHQGLLVKEVQEVSRDLKVWLDLLV